MSIYAILKSISQTMCGKSGDENLNRCRLEETTQTERDKTHTERERERERETDRGDGRHTETKVQYQATRTTQIQEYNNKEYTNRKEDGFKAARRRTGSWLKST